VILFGTRCFASSRTRPDVLPLFRLPFLRWRAHTFHRPTEDPLLRSPVVSAFLRAHFWYPYARTASTARTLPAGRSLRFLSGLLSAPGPESRAVFLACLLFWPTTSRRFPPAGGFLSSPRVLEPLRRNEVFSSVSIGQACPFPSRLCAPFRRRFILLRAQVVS